MRPSNFLLTERRLLYNKIRELHNKNVQLEREIQVLRKQNALLLSQIELAERAIEASGNAERIWARMRFLGKRLRKS